MTFLRNTFFFLLITISFSFAGLDDKLEKFFEVSGINKTIKSLPDFAKSGVMEAFNKSQEPSESLKKITDSLLLVHFDSEKMKQAIKDEVKKEISRRDMRKLLKFYKTDLAKKMTKLEEAGGSEESMNAAMQFDVDSFDKDKKTEIDQIYSDLKMLDFFLETQKIMIYTMLNTINANLPKDKRKGEEEVNKIADMTIEMMKNMYGDILIKGMYQMYAPATVEELKTYREFLNTPPSQRFYKGYMRGQSKTLGESLAGFCADMVVLTEKSNVDQ